MKSANDTFGLSELPKLLRNMTGRTVRYQSLYRRVIDGDLQATQLESGRWVVRRADLQEFVEAFVMKKVR